MFKYGLRPAKNAPALMFTDILKAVPAHPQQLDYLSPFSNWQVLGNDAYGDCVSVMCSNYVREISGSLGKEYYGGLSEVLAFYKTQNPHFVPNPNNPVEDNGMDIQTALEYWNKNAVFGRQLVAFAKVDAKNLPEVQAAIAIFGGVLLGCNVQGDQQTQFAKGLPWDYVPGSPIEGGHGIPGGGYNVLTPSKDVKFITWGEETVFTDNFWTHLMQEVWVAILPEHLGTKQFQEGISLDALVKAYSDITNGKVLPIPAPTPTPTPVPTPGDGCLGSIATQLLGAATKQPVTEARMERALNIGLNATIADLKKAK